MTTTIQRSALLLGTVAWGFVIACSSSPPASTEAPATTSEPRTESATTTVVAGYPVNVAVRSDSMHVATVADPTGATVYTYEGPYIMDDGTALVRCTIASAQLTGFHVLPMAALSDPSEFAAAAYYDYMGTAAAVAGEDSYDAQGCDSPAGAFTCTNKGACCDVHDACYAANGHCSWSSWLQNWVAVGALATPLAPAAGYVLTHGCAGCNTAVVGCMATSNPGQASCCSTGTCTQPWGNPGDQGKQCLCQNKPMSCTSPGCVGDAGASSSASSDSSSGSDTSGTSGTGTNTSSGTNTNTSSGTNTNTSSGTNTSTGTNTAGATNTSTGAATSTPSTGTSGTSTGGTSTGGTNTGTAVAVGGTTGTGTGTGAGTGATTAVIAGGTTNGGTTAGDTTGNGTGETTGGGGGTTTGGGNTGGGNTGGGNTGGGNTGGGNTGGGNTGGGNTGGGNTQTTTGGGGT